MNSSRKERKGRKENTKPGGKTGLESIGHSVSDSFYTVLEPYFAKIDQQAETPAAQPALGQNLFAVYRGELFHRLQLNDHFIFDQEVCAKSFIESEFVIANRNWHLPFYPQSNFTKLMRQHDFIHALQQSG